MTNDLAIKILNGDVLGTTEQTHEAVAMAVKALSALPSADVQQVRHGHWIYTPTNLLGYVCSECGNGMCRFNYCPHCGALMDGG